MKIENYLNTEQFKTRAQLVKETGLTDRTVRNAISELKKTRPVIYNSQTRGYRLAKDINSFNTVNAAIQESELIQHCINDIEARIEDMDKSEQTYIAYLNKLNDAIVILSNENHIPGY